MPMCIGAITDMAMALKASKEAAVNWNPEAGEEIVTTIQTKAHDHFLLQVKPT